MARPETDRDGPYDGNETVCVCVSVKGRMWKHESCCRNFVSNRYESPYDKCDRLHARIGVELLQPALSARVQKLGC